MFQAAALGANKSEHALQIEHKFNCPVLAWMNGHRFVHVVFYMQIEIITLFFDGWLERAPSTIKTDYHQ